MSATPLSSENVSQEFLMKAVRVSKPEKDASKAVQVEAIPIPDLKPGEYLVRIQVVPVHPGDRFTLVGMYPGCVPPDEWPVTPGIDGMGVISKAGPGALKYAVGERVAVAGFPLERGTGTWSTYVVLKENELVFVPDSVTDIEAAQFWTNPASAWCMLRAANVPVGGYVIFSGANSALARMGMYLAQYMELKPIGIVRTSKERDTLLKHNFNDIINLENEEILPRVEKITHGQGAYAALDAVGGIITGHLASSVKEGGVVILYGMMGDDVAHIAISSIMINRVRIEGFWLNGVVNCLSEEERKQMCNEIMDLITKRAILFAGVYKTYPLKDCAQAIKDSENVTDGQKVFINMH
jgi:NADPH:quinone reductase-like Zn-dependent oxidoreductase